MNKTSCIKAILYLTYDGSSVSSIIIPLRKVLFTQMETRKH